MKNPLNDEDKKNLKRSLNHVYCPQHPSRLISLISMQKNAQQKKGCLDCQKQNKIQDPIDVQTVIDEVIEAQTDLRQFLDNTLHQQIEKTLPEIKQKLIAYIERSKLFLEEQREELYKQIQLDKIQELYSDVKNNCIEKNFDQLYDFMIQWFEKSDIKDQIRRSENYENIKVKSNQFMLEQLDIVKNNISSVFNELNSMTNLFQLGQPKKLEEPQPLQQTKQPEKQKQQEKLKQDDPSKMRQIFFQLFQQKACLLETFVIKFSSSEDLTITKILLPKLQDANELKSHIQYQLYLNKAQKQTVKFKDSDDVWFTLKTPLKIQKEQNYEIKLTNEGQQFYVYSYKFDKPLTIEHISFYDPFCGLAQCLIIRGFQYDLGFS